MTTLAILLLGIGYMLVYAALKNTSVKSEIASVFGKGK